MVASVGLLSMQNMRMHGAKVKHSDKFVICICITCLLYARIKQVKHLSMYGLVYIHLTEHYKLDNDNVLRLLNVFKTNISCTVRMREGYSLNFVLFLGATGRFVRNVCKLVLNHTASHPRRH
jgi:hypothetical protein